MHFSIPDTVELKEANGSSFLAYNVHINGSFHSSIRFSELYQFSDQLKKEFGPRITAKFPPKRLLSLTVPQVEERRADLEKYLQIICQDTEVVASTQFNCFLLNCQKHTLKLQTENVDVDIYLMNGQKISLKIQSTDPADEVLEAAMAEIKLGKELVHYFGLFLIRREEDGNATIVRKLQEFEAPYLTLKVSEGKHRIAVRKSLWDVKLEEKIIQDKTGMNLLYVQAVSDVERGWPLGTKEIYSKLTELKKKTARKEYIKLAQKMKYYGFIQFKPCVADYPEKNTRIIASAGGRELNFRLQTSEHKIQEGSFKVTRMKCWRITARSARLENGEKEESLELAFEYLLNKESLQWITVTSDEAILMSLCLQGMVDEILRIKHGRPVKQPKGSVGSRQDNPPLRQSSVSSLASTEEENANTMPPVSPASKSQSPSSNPSSPTKKRPSRQLSGKSPGLQIRTGAANSSENTTKNEVFEGIGDDDL